MGNLVQLGNPRLERTFCNNDPGTFQVNLVDRETLLDARAHPELHQNLLVRVAGYSAQFVSLWDDLQEEIISRTGHVV